MFVTFITKRILMYNHICVCESAFVCCEKKLADSVYKAQWERIFLKMQKNKLIDKSCFEFSNHPY